MTTKQSTKSNVHSRSHRHVLYNKTVTLSLIRKSLFSCASKQFSARKHNKNSNQCQDIRVDILGCIDWSEVDRFCANDITTKSSIVLQDIARTVLRFSIASTHSTITQLLNQDSNHITTLLLVDQSVRQK